MIGNNERGWAAKLALDVFGRKMFAEPGVEDMATLVGDLIADLGHLVDQKGEGVAFEPIVEKAIRMWLQEKHEDAAVLATYLVRFESTAAVSITVEVEAESQEDAELAAVKLVSLSKMEEAAVSLCNPDEVVVHSYAKACGRPIVEVTCSLDENGFELVESEKMEPIRGGVEG